MAAQDNLRFGMVQGRLIQSPPGELQWFPQNYWESEFFIAPAIGVDYIELIAERNHNAANPVWHDEGVARLKELTERNGLSLHALCNDYIVDHTLPGDDEVLEQNLRLLDQGGKLGCEKFILPLFECSELTAGNHEIFSQPLRTIADKAATCGMIVCLETILTGSELISLLDSLDRPNIKVVYDTGNRIAFGHDLPADIRLLGKDRIAHVHIKDKNRANQNVLLGTGLVNFQTVFQALADIHYTGPFTFETQRGKDPIRTARYNMELVRFFHGETSTR
jgi:sugar phosphate isomerase/epimerase